MALSQTLRRFDILRLDASAESGLSARVLDFNLNDVFSSNSKLKFDAESLIKMNFGSDLPAFESNEHETKVAIGLGYQVIPRDKDGGGAIVGQIAYIQKKDLEHTEGEEWSLPSGFYAGPKFVMELDETGRSYFSAAFNAGITKKTAVSGHFVARGKYCFRNVPVAIEGEYRSMISNKKDSAGNALNGYSETNISCLYQVTSNIELGLRVGTRSSSKEGYSGSSMSKRMVEALNPGVTARIHFLD